MGTCDRCEKYAEIGRLPTGGSTTVFLCRECWHAELSWRKARNRRLPASAKFALPAFCSEELGAELDEYFDSLSEAE